MPQRREFLVVAYYTRILILVRVQPLALGRVKYNQARSLESELT